MALVTFTAFYFQEPFISFTIRPASCYALYLSGVTGVIAFLPVQLWADVEVPSFLADNWKAILHNKQTSMSRTRMNQAGIWSVGLLPQQ